MNTFERIVNTLHRIFKKKWRVFMLMVIKRGDIFYADLRPVVGSEQGGIRPVIVLQNDAGNKYSPTIICAAITSKMNKAKLPTHVPIDCHKIGRAHV